MLLRQRKVKEVAGSVAGEEGEEVEEAANHENHVSDDSKCTCETILGRVLCPRSALHEVGKAWRSDLQEESLGHLAH